MNLFLILTLFLILILTLTLILIGGPDPYPDPYQDIFPDSEVLILIPILIPGPTVKKSEKADNFNYYQPNQLIIFSAADKFQSFNPKQLIGPDPLTI